MKITMKNSTKVLIYTSILGIMGIIRRIFKNRIKKKRLWSRPWLLKRNSGRDLTNLVIDELKVEDEKGFQNFVRMTPKSFEKLLLIVKPLIEKQNTILRESISAKARLLITLRYLASGETFQSLSYSFRISQPAISLIITETIQAINLKLKQEYLKTPQTSQEWLAISERFERQWNFPCCLGALDGKHIAFRAKKRHGSFYYNYKGFNSIILLALVDADYNFLYVDVGCNGRTNDAGVYNNCTLCSAIEENLLNFPSDRVLEQTTLNVPYIIVADDAFRLTSRTLKPYGQRSTTEEKVFNYRLSRARRVVENAFGILANKFQILQKEINLSVEKVEDLVIATCILHNYIRREDGKKHTAEVDRENTSSILFQQGNWRSNVFLTKLKRATGNRSTTAAMDVRNKFCEFFNTVGHVPWQWEAIKKFNL